MSSTNATPQLPAAAVMKPTKAGPGSAPASASTAGIERGHQEKPSKVEELRAKWGWFDHLMRMQERYSTHGGNQYAAGITYFSVLALFPLLMVVFAVLGYVLFAHPEWLDQIKTNIVDSLDNQVGTVLNDILDSAISQRGTVASIGGITALWTGLGWMNNLRFGVSKMWRVDPTAGNFALKKLRDLVGLIGLLVAFGVAFGVTAVGNSGLTHRIISLLGLDDFPGIALFFTVLSIVVGLVANFLVMAWMILFLPRTNVPRKSGFTAALIAAVVFEAIKQASSLVASSAFNNPAGAVFGPIIGLMVMLYLVWRVVLYCSAWAATTEQSLAQEEVPTPGPAVIEVHTKVAEGPRVGAGLAASVGVVAGALLGVGVRRRRRDR